MRLLATSIVIMLLASASASAETRARYGRTLEASLLGQPVNLDPHAATSHAEMALADLAFDGLYRLDRDGTIEPELASALPEVGPDKLSVKICVRVGVAFHDGSKLAVGDVVASLKRLSAGSAGWLLAAVSSIAAGEGEDEGCVLLQLRYPEPQLPRTLASPVAAITRRGKRPRRRVIGTGPFRVRKLDGLRRQLRLGAFKKHHRGRPYLDGLSMRWFARPDEEARAYEVGDIHISARGAVAFSGHKPKYETSSAAGPATILAYVGFGRSNPALLGNTHFRRAVSLAIRRAGMRNLGTGERVVPTVSPVARALGGRSPSSRALGSQMPQARRELASAAKAIRALENPSSVKLQILVDRSRHDDRDIADKVMVALHKLGISASVVERKPVTFERHVSAGSCDLYIGQLVAPVATIDAQLAAAFAAGRDSWARNALSRGPLDRASAESEFRRRLPIVPLLHRAVRIHHRNDVLGLRFDGSAQIEWADLSLFGRAKINR